MATEFPTMIEWAFGVGQNELIRQHQDYQKDTEEEISFGDFVEGQYESAKMSWEDEMFNSTKMYNLKYEIDYDGDILLEMAKFVFVKIFNESLISGKVPDIILKDELAPEAESARFIVHDYIYKLIPAVLKMLKELK
jgi:hypothetical protein